jgi:hypothetical protein
MQLRLARDAKLNCRHCSGRAARHVVGEIRFIFIDSADDYSLSYDDLWLVVAMQGICIQGVVEKKVWSRRLGSNMEVG